STSAPHRTPLSLSVSFAAASPAALRDLHSFPTRRSSDLKCVPRVPNQPISSMPWPCKPWLKKTSTSPRLSPISLPQMRYKTPMRSEEHTSELQSRFDLVCRLLLEKKKLPK